MPAVIDFENVPQLFNGLADRYAGTDRKILRHRDKDSNAWIGITWDEFRERVRAMAGFLYSKGVRPGDRVAILSENRPEWAITDMATQLLGAVNVSLYTSLPSAPVAFILHDSQSKIFVVSTAIQVKKARDVFNVCPDLEAVIAMSEPKQGLPEYAVMYDAAVAAGRIEYEEHRKEIEGFGENVSPRSISALIYTSGTTGNPKGVMLTHRNFCANVKATLDRIPVSDEDNHLSFLPLCHSFERTAGYTAVLAYGGTITYAQSFDTVARDLMEVRPTVLLSVPRLFEKIYNGIKKSVDQGSAAKKSIFNWSIKSGMQYVRATENGKKAGPILKAKRALAHKLVFSKLHEKLGGRVRFAASGGAALPKEIGEFFMAAGVRIIEAYGLTETAPVLTVNPYSQPRFGTVGHVIDGVTIGIQSLGDKSIIGQLSGEDYPSSLTTEDGEIVAKGPNIMLGYWNNEAATKEAIDDEGWYHTGDVGRFEDGYLRITDRIKHMIVSKGGKNIYPGPIEDGFKTESLIDQIMVVGEGREFLTALIVPDQDAVRSYAKEHGVTGSKLSELLASDEIQSAISGILKAYSKLAVGHEKIRDFRFVTDPFTVENGMMTPTMKLKRRIIKQNYADVIEEMYAHVV